ncbi:TetR/AcrR family transcriptional regulator [Phytohabitans flavus]|uniref:TetR family transcriptional regulator n=1 Tax=Phytohabitans flavus TaxID=1076124 RepID=A0A6F8XPB8_9ACTN|nr:TetR family transcriptional regulator [Phytohabitans flavus]
MAREDWVEAALAAIAEGGVSAVAVEPIAAQLGTTKGSFYWHFPNRAALLEAALSEWEERTTTAVIDEIANATEDPAGQLRTLIVRVIDAAERDRVGPALLAAAGQPAVARAIDRVTRARIGLIVTVFSRLGFPLPEARSRALLAYSAYLGHAQLAHSTEGVLPDTADGRRAYLRDVMSVLTADTRTAASDT